MDGTLVQERGAGAQARRRRDLPWRGHSRGHQGAAAIRRELCRRLSGRAGLAPARRAGRRRGHHRRSRRAPGDLHQRGLRRRHARRLDQLSAARRRDLEVDRRHQRGGRRALQPLLPRRHRRRHDHPRRGLRRGRERDPGALVRLCDEVVDVAARSAAGPAHHRAHGRGRLRAVRSDARAGDAGAAHPRLSRHRRVQDQGQPPRRQVRQGPPRRPAALRIRAAGASARHLHAGTAQDRGAAAGGAEVHPRAQAQRSHPGRSRRRRHHRHGRADQQRAARAVAARSCGSLRRLAHPDLRAQRRLSAGAGGTARVLRRQARRAGGRGRLARLHRAAGQRRTAPRRHPDQGLRQRACCRAPANTSPSR